MAADQRPAKRTKLLEDSEDSGDESASNSSNSGLKINSEFAKRFEHNKKREEKEKLEEKYGKDALSESSDSESEDEDDAGDLADAQNDAQFQSMIQALKSKDPRIYEQGVKFFDEAGATPAGNTRKQTDQPLRLQDYHRNNLLRDVEAGGQEAGENGVEPIRTYGEEQADLKRDLLRQADQDSESAGESDDDNPGFLKAKPKPVKNNDDGEIDEPLSTLDIENADQDPEEYLSKFMASRAWVPSENSKFQAFESEDDEYDDAADRYEDRYNMRFEDPEKANETIKTHSRDAASQYSVRREDPTGRKKARATQRAAEKSEKDQRTTEKERLRRLQIEEAQEKLQQFKEAAGLHGKEISVEDWSRFLEAGFDDDNWEEQMTARFGDDYYDERDSDPPAEESDASNAGAQKSTTTKQKKKLKKPKWDEDIDINDIIPDFDEEEEQNRAKITLSDDDDDDEDDNDQDEDDEMEDEDEDTSIKETIEGAQPRRKSNKKDKIKQTSDRKRQSRLERQQIEDLVDRKLATDAAVTTNEESVGPFKYRDTSPTSFGLSAQEILMADDSQLNQYAGLKKLASFRDSEKKKKDKKYYSKKARLRQWRQETFGDDAAPMPEKFEEFVRNRAGRENGGGGSNSKKKRGYVEVEDTGPSKKRRRARKRAIAAGEM